MRRAMCCVCAILISDVLCHAAAPATRPAPPEPGPVLILPFVPPAGGKYDWISKSVQQDLVSGLAPNLRGRAIAPADTQPAPDTVAALKAGRDEKAAVVVFGQAQAIGQDVRLTGQILDVASGKALGSLKATGSAEGLFQLEDDLVRQAIAALPRPLLNLHGLLARQASRQPTVYYLPGDAPSPSAGPIGQNHSLIYVPYTSPQPLTYSAPPYSPYSGSYPGRFYYPYAHLFSYDTGPHVLLPIGGGLYAPGFGPEAGGEIYFLPGRHR